MMYVVWGQKTRRRGVFSEKMAKEIFDGISPWVRSQPDFVFINRLASPEELEYFEEVHFEEVMNNE